MKYCLLLFFTAGAFLLSAQEINIEIEKMLDLKEAEASKKDQPSINTENRNPFECDEDRDGMYDDWEIANGFDPTDPTDAWEDADGDKILNLFEFQLETDPADAASPEIVNFDSATMDLETLFDEGNGGLIVVRVRQGLYPMSYLNFNSVDYRIMIQGGWNDDYTEYDPELYPTIFDGNYNDEVLYFGISSVADEAGYRFSVVLDGLELTRGNAGFGTLTIINDEANFEGHVSVYNCKIYDGIGPGITLNHRDTGSTTSLFLVNTSVTDHESGIIGNQTTNGMQARWDFINVTFADNAGPINMSLGNDSQKDVKVQNGIIRDNGQSSFALPSIPVTFEMSYSNFDPVSNPGSTIVTGNNNLDVDPLFVDPLSGNYKLQPISPCVNAGVDVGLFFDGPAPEMGAFEVPQITSTNSVVVEWTFELVENPVQKNGVIAVNLTKLQDGTNPFLSLYNQHGQILRKQRVDRSGRIEMPTPLTAGTYYISLGDAQQNWVTKKVIVQ